MAQPSVRDSLLMAASLIIIFSAMKAASAIVLPFLLAGFLALLAAAPMGWMTARGVPTWIALPTAVLMLLGAVSLFLVLIAGNSGAFAERFPFYQSQLLQQVGQVQTWLGGWGIDTSDYDVRELLEPGAAVAFVGGAFNQARKLLTNGLLILLTVIFMLLEVSALPDRIRRLSTSPLDTELRATRFVQAIRHYLVIKFGISVITGILAWFLCWIFGVDFPLLWGVVAFALNFIPTIGSIIAAIPPVLLALVELGFFPALGVAGGFAAINVFMGSGIEPRLMGEQLGLSTLVVFLSLVFWGWMFGPIGALLSVPLTISGKFALESDPATARYAVLLDSGKPPPTVKMPTARLPDGPPE
ncbi:MAG: AI-2E family transporter [Pseudomonadota bacterium]